MLGDHDGSIRPRYAAVAVLAVVAVAAPSALATHRTGCGDGDFHDPGARLFANAQGHDDVRVELVDLEPFSPATLAVDPGTCINFVNPADNGLVHNVQILAGSDGAVFHQVDVNLAPGQNVTWEFTEAGTFHVNCDFNAFHAATMHQVVEVR